MSLSVLIVEDEWIIGEDLKDRLEQAGYAVLGPALSCSAALELMWRERPDIAFVDTHLGNETCEAVLEECDRQGVPVIISSGHGRQDLPEFAHGFPYLGKPYSSEAVERVLVASREPFVSRSI
jgi:DNA-binding response OmpR family regulator